MRAAIFEHSCHAAAGHEVKPSPLGVGAVRVLANVDIRFRSHSTGNSRHLASHALASPIATNGCCVSTATATARINKAPANPRKRPAFAPFARALPRREPFIDLL